MVDGNGSGGLNLESLIAAQERVTDSEAEYVNSILTYNLAMINLKRTNGTLLSSENVNVSKNCADGECKQIDITKGVPNDEVAYYPQAVPTGAIDFGPAQGTILENTPVGSEQFQSLPISNAPVGSEQFQSLPLSNAPVDSEQFQSSPPDNSILPIERRFQGAAQQQAIPAGSYFPRGAEFTPEQANHFKR